MTIQKNMRMYLVKKRYGPRINGISKIKSLQTQIESMRNILDQIKTDKEHKMAQESLKTLTNLLNATIDKIKNSLNITENQIDQAYNDLFSACERDFKKLKALLENQKNKEEQERLRKIQDELVKAQRQKEDEQNKKIMEENLKKQ